MNATDYIIDILLIASVFRQLRTRELTARNMILPLLLIVWAGTRYLHSFRLEGNDLDLILMFATLGIVLGAASGAATSVWRDESGTVLARAGIIAAATWVAGMGFRLAFSIYANSHNGGHEIGQFSAQHAISSGQVWTTALVLMAFGEVLARVAVLQARRIGKLQASVAVNEGE